MNFFRHFPQTVCPTSTDVNPDMQGYAVRLSSFITHLVVAILLAWSDEHTPRFCYTIVFLQLLFPIFGTFLAIKHDQLNFQDVQFLIVQLRSPVCVYIFLFVIPRLFLYNSAFVTSTPKNRRLDRTVLRDRAFATLALLTFVSLRLVVLFDRCAYASSTSSDYFSTHFETHAFIALMLCTLGIYASVYRHQEERRSLMHSLAGIRRRKLFSTLPWRQRVVSGFCATWTLVMHRHPWLIFTYVTVMFAQWSVQMRIWAVEDGYQFTYGQFLSITPNAVGALFECRKLFKCRKLLSNRGRRRLGLLPRRLAMDIGWLVLGRGQRWANLDRVLSFKTPWAVIPPDAGWTSDTLPQSGSLTPPVLPTARSRSRRERFAARRLAARRRRLPTHHRRVVIQLRRLQVARLQHLTTSV
ncbi:hypothetical protein B0H14DRAFT_2772472 [Mycena olivaceomarginata]|nr:hypothetical protein B0H14DRAFT_2772472 [Mycena olivaceomarginata]